jgi:hypothetical protein
MTLLEVGLWPGPIWAGYRLNGSLKTGFTTNRFHSVSGYLENGPNRFETGQIFPKRAEKNPGSTRVKMVFLPVYKGFLHK